MPFNRAIPESKPRPAKPVGALGALAQAEKMLDVAILLPLAAFVGWAVGAWLDRHLHQSWIGVGGSLFGGVSALVYVARMAIRSMSGAENGKKSGKGSSNNKP
jgi:hypothetical protein